MKHDSHNRRKAKRPQSNTKRSITEVSSPVTDFNIRGVSGDGKSVIGYFTGRENGWEPHAVLRHLADYFSSTAERIRKSLQLGYELRTCEITWEEMDSLYNGDVHSLQTSTAMYAYNKLVNAGFDMSLPIHSDQDMNRLVVMYHQYAKESLSCWLKKKASVMWTYFLEH